MRVLFSRQLRAVKVSRRFWLRLALLSAVLAAGLVLGLVLARYPLQWNPIDYDNFREYGEAFRQGEVGFLYPLGTVMWLFTPLSVAPSWFVVVWVAGPFLVCLRLFGLKGAALWPSAPLLMNAAVGQIDAWLLLPVFWLLRNDPRYAGPSAALLTLKPQLAFAIVPFMLVRWLRDANRRALLGFLLLALVLHAPSFLLDPNWPQAAWPRVIWRGSQSLLLTRGASLWAWWWRGGATGVLVSVAAAAALFVRAHRHYPNQAIFLIGLLGTPVLFPLSFSTAIGALPESRLAVMVFTTTSWLAMIIDHMLGGWGGAYALVPLSVLALLAHQKRAGPTTSLDASTSLAGSAVVGDAS